MGRYVRKTGPAVNANELKEADAQQRTIRAHGDEETRRAILRQVRLGLSDNQVAKRLSVKPATVARYREEAEMKANPLGGALD